MLNKKGDVLLWQYIAFLKGMSSLYIEEKGRKNDEKKDDGCCQETGHGKINVQFVEA